MDKLDRFGLPECNYQDAMEMGNSLARGIVSQPDAFSFDERVLCRAFCFSAREEILATQHRDSLAAQVKALREALWNIMSGVDDHIKAGKIECGSCASNVAEARKALDSTR